MIPENKRAAVNRALLSTFKTDSFDAIEQLTKGLSSALVFKITVRGAPYLLRVVTRSDTTGDPSFYYGCMRIAAKNKVAPLVHYLSIEDRISITDFIIEKPFLVSTAKQMLPHLLRKLHALPKFSFRFNYFEAMEKFIGPFEANHVLPESKTRDLIGLYRRIADVYPKNDINNWVSCHNDTKAENILFDGQRPWLVDWEAAFLNDRYLDLAIVSNFIVATQKDEIQFLETYFDERVNEYQYARFCLMQEILHFYYFVFLLVSDKGSQPIDFNTIIKRGFREFHKGMWNGSISLAATESKRQYARLHLEKFLLKAQTDRFRDSLKIVSRYHH